MTVPVQFALIGGVILVGFLANLLFRLTRIPSVLLLIVAVVLLVNSCTTGASDVVGWAGEFVQSFFGQQNQGAIGNSYPDCRRTLQVSDHVLPALHRDFGSF